MKRNWKRKPRCEEFCLEHIPNAELLRVASMMDVYSLKKGHFQYIQSKANGSGQVKDWDDMRNLEPGVIFSS